MARRFLSTLASHIEIERKFLPTHALLNAITRPTESSPARLPPSIAHIHPAPKHFIQDIYYDRADGGLVSAGVWVRRRSILVPGPASPTSSWEAKVRVGGDFAASQFVEVQGAEAVEREIHRAVGARVAVDKIADHLAVMCDLTTRRLEGRVQLAPSVFPDDEDGAGLETLTVVIDQAIETPRAGLAGAPGSFDTLPDAAFSHEVGELEIVQEVRTEGDAVEKHEAHRKAVAGRRALQLGDFMRAHPALFPMEPKPRGKLEAYFAWAAGRRV
ncbi:hypothetical protein B0H15DRAFT_861711 [Mycena belliarum]|uniref:CYTH domain-containing protein n=1 Tax=Mycena belliarum TaxID=1033014 RepID=A0AAD6XGJ3_9AGAR|nr:hypothetical protein B0H15DRAFT_861711 [Mycena belliae]